MSNTATVPVNYGAKRVGEIDLLRFVAAISVVLFHYIFRGYAASSYSPISYPELGSIAKYGYLGVELFFLISGFVILMTASSGSLRKFVISRLVRLYPAYWACCSATFLAILLFDNQRFSASVSQYIINMTMLNEFIGVPSIDGVYWSLAVELKFYAMVTLVLLFRQMHRVQWLLIAWLALSIGLEVFPIGRIRSLFFTAYAPYFVGGATFFLVYSNGLSMLRIFVLITAWACAVWGAVRGTPDMSHHFNTEFSPYVIAFMVSIFFAVMLLIALQRTKRIGSLGWATLGALTYPLYLIHQYIGYLIFNSTYIYLNKYLILIITLTLMLLVAFAINRQIERRYAHPMKLLLEKISSRFKAQSSP
jgi:peptidoglycan/LPS O-acetylase OafA/YrhL